jgi:hypothetical protein
MSIVFLFDENPDVASTGSGGAAVGGARSVPDHAPFKTFKTLGRIRNRFERLERFELLEPGSNIDQLACLQQRLSVARTGSFRQSGQFLRAWIVIENTKVRSRDRR